MKNRICARFAQEQANKQTGRILVLTGARQTGKTTLCKTLFPLYSFISIEDPVLRPSYANLTAAQWKKNYPLAILDEIQKEPKLIESIKSVYDQWEEPRYILTGSSQLLLLEKVRESLAGRCIIFEIFPLTLPELGTNSTTDEIIPSIFIELLQSMINDPSNKQAYEKIPPSFHLDPRMSDKTNTFSYYQNYGGYPALTEIALEQDRFEWLKNYVKTYLERDIRDLASFRDLDAFTKLQRYLAQQTATVINTASISRQLGLSAQTVQRYIRYFELSYQAIILPSWSRNEQKRLTRASKIHYMDNGVLQAVLQKRGGTTGFEFESLVISEMYKQIKSMRLDVSMYHLRTSDGREIDLLIEVPKGYIAFEIKMSEKVGKHEARHIADLNEILDKPLLHSFILSFDPHTRYITDSITAVHTACFLA